MTDLIWDGKYKDNKKQGPVRILANDTTKPLDITVP